MSFAKTSDAHFTKALNDGIELFNRGDHFEAHEIWEEWWQDEVGAPRRFVQGLIQVAAALYKCTEGVPSGTFKLLEQAMRFLEEFRPAAYGIDVEDLYAACVEWRDRAGAMLKEGVTLRPDHAYPLLRPAPPLNRGHA